MTFAIGDLTEASAFRIHPISISFVEMTPEQIKKVKAVFSAVRAVDAAFLFGSRARGKFRVDSDYDFAVLLNRNAKKKYFRIQLDLLGKLIRELKNDRCDLLVLNDTPNLILQNAVLRDGILLYESPSSKQNWNLINYRIATLGQYWDFRAMEQRYYRE